MTKFVLNGGDPFAEEQRAKLFVDEFTEGKKKIVVCPFAKPAERREGAALEISEKISGFRPGLEIQHAEPANFSEFLAWTEVVYFVGGRTNLLIEELKNFSDLREMMDGKVVAGESAGANAFATYYYGLHSGDVQEGLGFLPVKIVAHYQSDYNGPEFDWAEALHKTEQHGDQWPVWCLKEGEYAVMESEQLG